MMQPIGNTDEIASKSKQSDENHRESLGRVRVCGACSLVSIDCWLYTTRTDRKHCHIGKLPRQL